VFVVGAFASGYQGLSIADTAGNAFVLQPAGCGFDGGARILCLYIVYSSIGGADTITVTDTGGGSNRVGLAATEYIGAAAYPLDQWTYNTMQYFSSSITTNSATSVTSNDIAVAVGFAGNNSGTNASYSASGFTLEASSVSSDTRASIGLLDKTVATAGSANAVVNGTEIDGVGFVLLRTVLPTMGNIQTYSCKTTSGASLACSLPQTATTTDAGIAYTFGSAADDVDYNYMLQISGLCSVPWKIAPFAYYGAPPGGQIVWYCTALSAGTTVTAAEYTPGHGNQQIDVEITEVRGIANSTPLVMMPTWSSSNGITTVADSITITGAGNFYLYNVFGDQYGSSTYSNSGTALIAHGIAVGNYVKQLNDSVVTAGTYTQTVTSTSAQEYSINIMVAFAANIQTGSQIVQISNGGGTAGSGETVRPMTIPVQTGNTLINISGWQSGASSFAGPTDSLGNTWTLICGGTANYYGVWKATVAAGGSDIITTNPSSVTTSTKLFEISGVTGVDASTCSQLTGTSISPNQITTTNATDLLISFAQNSGACNPPNISLANSGNWTSVGGSGSHCAQGGEAVQFVTSAGTYGNAATSASSSTMNAGIFGLEGSAPASYVPPQISGNVKISGNVQIQ
jgi:hypothetical protein